MKTAYIKIDPAAPDEKALKEAAECIKHGGLVAFPTETVYGLGADTFNPDAVKKIYTAKGRPGDNPLISHIADMDSVLKLAQYVPEDAKNLMEEFWGGPLTIILKRRKEVPDIVSAGLDTVSVRMPSHSVANALIRIAGTPIAAPSANLSGSPSPTTFEHCKADMDGRVDMIIDGGDCSIGVESTVVDMTGDEPVILRPGAVTLEDIVRVCGKGMFGGEYADAPKCPGMKYTHYSPDAEVFAVNDMESFAADKKDGTAIIAYNNYAHIAKGNRFYSAGDTDTEYAARLFYLLRKADEEGIKTIYAQLPENKGMGTAIRNRLLKSAGGRII
ncbi:MAG: threonylcarbamoyl-AMP synthase [Clostridia bacterium]|nr:threonylcarbamoyl-AMP synthase [Clostridia bacterium]